MKMKKLFFLLLISPTICSAGFNGLTTHSRANCINNETISWDLKAYHNLRNSSDHYDTINKKLHTMIEPKFKFTWRDATVHWGEGFRKKWLVSGYHQELYCSGVSKLIGRERVDNCDMYNGWWDTKKEDQPEKKDPCKEGYSAYAKVLLNFRDDAKKQYMQFRNNTDPYSTHLRMSPTEIKHTFKFKPLILDDKVDIGFAPVGTWNNGWTGMKEFFESPSIGNCSYEVNRESRLIDIPIGKITPWEGGGAKSGYITTLLWQDAKFVYDFQCATKTKRSIKEQMMKLI